MRHGCLIAGYDALTRLPHGMNHHVADIRGRAVYCDCFRWIRLGGGRKLACNRARSKARGLTQMYREIRFNRNLDRALRR